MSSTLEKSGVHDTATASDAKNIKPLDKWVTAVMDLVRLTQHDQIVWHKAEPSALTPKSVATPETPETLQDSDAFAKIMGSEVYEANFKEQILKLVVVPEINPPKTDYDVLNLFFALGRRSEKIILTVFKETGEVVTRFPNTAPLKALALAVHSQLHRDEDAFLQALHNAE